MKKLNKGIKLEDLLISLKGDYIIYVIDDECNYEFLGMVSEYVNNAITDDDIEVIVEDLRYESSDSVKELIFSEDSLSYNDYEKDRGNINQSLFEYEKVLVINYTY